jgi:hypothetical protein
LSTGGHTLTARPASTRNWDDYRVLYMGTIKIPASSDTTVTVKVLEKPMNYVMNLQGVILTPEEN